MVLNRRCCRFESTNSWSFAGLKQEINDQEVAGTTQKEKSNNEKTELKILEFNNKVVQISAHKEKVKITKDNTFDGKKIEKIDIKEQAVCATT